MTTVKDIISHLESIAPLHLQESYDNCGLLTGNANDRVSNILVTLDCTEEIIDEAVSKNCNLIISHHPIIFTGLKKLIGSNYIERSVIKALKNDISIYAIHTNLDNVLVNGVNSKIAEKLNLKNIQILRKSQLKLAKLVTYVPIEYTEKVRDALFNAGAGNIGNYSNCSFNSNGEGTFKGNDISNPFIGEKNKLHFENETRIETVFPIYLKNKIIDELTKIHPYEEVAYDIYMLQNENAMTGSGILGELEFELNKNEFLHIIKQNMGAEVIKFTECNKSKIKKVAICGGAGSFLLSDAIANEADAFITADFKYHEFFNSENRIMICDIGHFESEHFTSELIIEIIKNKFPTFAPVFTETNTNPVKYFY